MLAKEFCEKHKVSITYASVPLRKDDAKGSFRYVVAVIFAGKAPHNFEYWKGSGHIGIRVLIGKEFKDGNYVSTYGWKRVSEYEARRMKSNYSSNQPKPIPPQDNEVLYCLAMDAQCIRDYPLWEDFADSMGYNVDSIKEKKIFEACCDNYRKLREIFGQPILNELMTVEDE